MTDMDELRISKTVSYCALAIFCASILLPQGVGLRFAPTLPNLDLPRIMMLAMLGLLLTQVPKLSWSAFRHAPRTLGLLIAVSIWQFLSAAASNSPRWSVLWAIGNVITYWGFAFAVIVLAGPIVRSHQLAQILFVLAALLALWSAFEFITQLRVIAERNIYEAAEHVVYSPYLRRRVLVDGVEIAMPIMAIGPYAINLTLGAVLCALGGFLLVRHYASGVLYFLSVALFVFGVLSTQSRVAVIAAALMLVVVFFWATSGRDRLYIVLSCIAAAAAFVLLFGPSDFLLAFGNKFFGGVVLHSDVPDPGAAPGDSGTIQARWYGLTLLWEQIGKFWLLGYGPGSVSDAARTGTTLGLYSDQGSFFGFFVELGMIAGSMIAIVVFASIVEGALSRDAKTRAAALGLMGFGVTALSSVTPWGWGVALVLAGLVESWAKTSNACGLELADVKTWYSSLPGFRDRKSAGPALSVSTSELNARDGGDIAKLRPSSMPYASPATAEERNGADVDSQMTMRQAD